MSIEYPSAEPDARPARTPSQLGITAASLALGFGAIVITAVVVAADGDHPTGTALAWIAIVGTAFTFLLGIAAVVLGRSRRWGAVAIILSLLINPWLLQQILRFFDTLSIA